MDICDMSAIDWEAVGALGTWFVGAAAVFVAVRANSLSKAIRESESQRQAAIARHVALGMRMELHEYIGLLGRLAECIAESREDDPLEGLHNVLRAFERYPPPVLSPIGDRAGALGVMPRVVSDPVNATYAQAPVAQKSAERLKKLIEKSLEYPELHEAAQMQAIAYGLGLGETAAHAKDAANVLGKYLEQLA